LYTCVIFDVDGTIIDSEKAIIRSLQKTLKEVKGHDYDFGELAFAIGIPGSVALAKLGIEDIEAVNDKWNGNLKEFYADIQLYPGIDLVLKRLRDSGIMTGIVTSKTKQELEDDFVPFGLMKYLPTAVVADDTSLHKPNPEPMLKFLERSGADPSRALYIGDTVHDMRCAAGAGVDFALASWGAMSPDSIDANIKLRQPLDILKLVGLDGA